MPSFADNILPLTAGQSLGSSTLPWNVFASSINVTNPTGLTVTNLNNVGNETVSGNLTVNGISTFIGNLSADSINSVLYVGGSITAWGGGDIGSQINAAYAALPVTGGTIYILPGNYSFTTPILFTTSGKTVLLAGLAPGGTPSGGMNTATILNYTPTTATIAITMDFLNPSGGAGVGYGLRDFALINGTVLTTGGTGSSATGVKFGPTNSGALGAEISNMQITGFSIGVDNSFTVNSWGITFRQCSISFNTTGLKAGGAENTFINGGRMVGNGTAIISAGSDITAVSVSFDNNLTTAVNYTNVAGVPMFTAVGCHWETGSGGNGAGVGATLFISGNMNTALLGGDMLDDYATGTATAFISTGGNHISVLGTEMQTSGQAVTQLFNLSGNVSGEVHIFNQSPAVLTDATLFNAGAQSNSMDWVVWKPIGYTPNTRKIANTFKMVETATVPNAQSNTTVCYPDSTSHALKCSYNNGSFFNIPQTIVNGTSTFTTTAVGAGACQTTVTTAATGAATTDSIEVAYASAPGATTDSLLIVNSWPTSGNVNFSRCNPTAGSITPTALVLNWRVIR